VTVVSSRLLGKTAVVTGGASGLGEAIAGRFASEGARVVVADLDEAAAGRVADDLVADGAAAEAVTMDVTREADVAKLFEGVASDHGGLDALVCSAAVEVRAPLVETSDDDWQRIIDVNLKGPFLCMKHGIPLMAGNGGGSCVLMGSTLGSIGSPNYAAYCASKGALVNLAKQAAIEHAPDGVRVNVVSPTATEAGLFLKMAEASGDPEGIKRFVAERIPMGRLGRVDDVTDAALYLASDASSYVSGTVIPLDGGLAARRMVP
jgi:meso-butanediol dehydrogenase / (S,S)-butanediol dehydrogenase / diacetyl reductase